MSLAELRATPSHSFLCHSSAGLPGNADHLRYAETILSILGTRPTKLNSHLLRSTALMRENAVQ